MDTTFAIVMPTKEWSPDQIKELAALAKGRGVSKRELAEEYIGCTPVTLSFWMSPDSGRIPSDLARNAMSYAEIRIKRLPEKARRNTKKKMEEE